MSAAANASPAHEPARPRLVALAWPLMAEMLLGFAVSLMGLALAARVGDASAAAFGLTNHVLGAFFLLFRIVSMGASVVITQQLGAQQTEAARASARAAFAACAWLGVSVACVVAASAPGLMSFMQAPAEVERLAVPFLRTLALALGLDAMLAITSAVLRAQLRSRQTLMVSLAIHATHLALCVPAMSHWGLPGFALAMAASRVLGLALLLVLWQKELGISVARRDAWRPRWAPLVPMLHIGVPGAAENIAYRLAMLAALNGVAAMGTAALATHSYATQITNLIVLFALAIGFAGEILIGHLVGAGQLHKADRLLHRSVALGLAGGTGIALAAALAGPWLLRGFTQDPAILRAAATLLWVNVLLEPGRTLNVVVINALRAAGDARFPVAFGAVSMLLVMAGGAWLLGTHFGLGLLGVWLAFAADEWLRGLTMLARWRARSWVGLARQAHARARRALAT